MTDLLHVAGGLERVCIINDDADVVRGKMRFSGDIVKQADDGSLCYVSRQDDEVKRHGKRVHLNEIEQVRIFTNFMCVWYSLVHY